MTLPANWQRFFPHVQLNYARSTSCVPRSARWMTVFALIWVISPIDLIPGSCR